MNSIPTPAAISLILEPAEVEELLNYTETILRDNGPASLQRLKGADLVAQVLLHNDPENFRARNSERLELVEELLQMQGVDPAMCVGTYAEAEIEYEYLQRMCSLYLKLYRELEA
ncbi:MAG: hypothetical protein ACFB20_06040 [Opitutales bacterium]